MKFKSITEDLRTRIIKGEFAPQTAIPTRNLLLEEYSSSNSALQRSINTLIDEGFLESRGIKGMYVAANPPHLAHYALCFPTDSVSNLNQDSVWKAMYQSAAEITAESNGVISFKPYFIKKTQDAAENEWSLLIKDIDSHLLAGAIIIISEKIKPPQFPEHFPYVVYDYEIEEQYPHGIRLATDHVKLFTMALQTLEEQQCQKIAAIAPSNLNLPSVLHIREHMAAAKSYFPPEWLLPMDHQHGTKFLSAAIINLLFSDQQKVKPDGLIVMNESLLPLIIDALAARGIICGRDVKIVSHCNYPMNFERQPQVTYLGFKAQEILQSALDKMRDYRCGQKAVTEQEFLIAPVPVHRRD